jgi:hypothetical protein
MKKKLLAIASAMAMTLVSVTTAHAAIINLAVGDAYYVGVVIDGIPPNDALEPAYLNSLIEVAPGAIDAAPPGGSGCNYATTETCNRVGSTLAGLPGVELTGQFKANVANESSGNILVNGWEYISGKYGSEGIRYWYIGGLLPTDFVTLPPKFAGTTGPGGLSHYTLYNVPGRTVPDGGTTAALLGLSIVGLGMIRRRINF